MLRIYLFGHLRLAGEAGPLPFAPRAGGTGLLAYLILHRDRAVARDTLAAALWGDSARPAALARLRRHLHEVERALPPAAPGRPWIARVGGDLWWNPDAGAWVDVAAFEAACRDPARLAEAADLYAGDFVPELYADWAAAARERLRDAYGACLRRLADQRRAAGDLAGAAEAARRALAHDPAAEDVGRALMALLYAEGDRGAALEVFRAVEAALAATFGVPPAAATVAARDAIAAGEGLPDTVWPLGGAVGGVGTVPAVPPGGAAADVSAPAASLPAAIAPAPERTSTSVIGRPATAADTGPAPAATATPPPGTELAVWLLGRLRVAVSGRVLPPLGTESERVLAYLVLHRAEPAPRAYLAFVLWPDVPEAEGRARLRRHLHQLRQSLGGGSTPAWLTVDDRTVQVDAPGTAWVDAAAFERLAADDDRLAEAVDLYAGPLLPRLHDAWAVVERERLHHAYRAALDRASAAALTGGDAAGAAAFAARLLTDQPLDESAARRLMRARLALGDRVGALAAYGALDDALRGALGVAPMPATRALRDAIAGGGALPAEAGGVGPGGDPDAWAGSLSPAVGQVEDVDAGGPSDSTDDRGGAAGPGSARGPEPAAVPSNLPAPRTSFVGRAEAVATIEGWLGAPGQGARLVTITGPGGVGKTRLALEAAGRLRDARPARFPDGVFFVDLSALGEARLVGPAIAAALGLAPSGAQPLMDRLGEHLAPRALLLVLDNFEHVLDAAALVPRLLDASPRLGVLATSRSVLRLYGEHEVSLPPLGLPEPASAGAAADSEAVRLFVQRAAAVRPGWAPRGDELAAVAELCRRFDGLPLAIEILAAHIRLLSPAAMLARLAPRPTALAGRRVDVPARHRSLRDAMDWGFQLLGPSQRALFCRLAVFAGGFGLEAAAAVCGGADAPSAGAGPGEGGTAQGSGEVRAVGGGRSDAARAADPGGRPPPSSSTDGDPAGVPPAFLADLEGLVEASMLARVEDPDGAAAGGLRFRMLRVVREHGREMLAARGELAAVSARHAAHFSALAAAGSAGLRGPEQARWLRVLALEHDNFRAALAWFHADAGAATAELALAADLIRFWEMRVHFEEGSRMMARALARCACDPPDALQLRALIGASDLATGAHDLAGGRVFAERALAVAEAIEDDVGMLRVLNSLAGIAWRQRDYAAAEARLHAALAANAELGNERLEVVFRGNLGVMATEQGRPAAAVAQLAPALALARRLEIPFYAMQILAQLGRADLALGDLAAAEGHTRELHALAVELGNDEMLAAAHALSGALALERGDLGSAHASYRACIEVAGRIDDLTWVAQGLLGLGRLALRAGRAKTAVRLVAAARGALASGEPGLTAADARVVEAVLAEARTALGDAAFEAAQAAGGTLARDAAIALAIAATADLVGER